MGADLPVDLEGLEHFATQLNSIKDRMNGTRSLFDSCRRELGSEYLADALDDFEHNWKDGREEIDGHLDGLAKTAQHAVEQIREADRDLPDQLTQSTKGEQKT
jgi:hypothetical protein